MNQSIAKRKRNLSGLPFRSLFDRDVFENLVDHCLGDVNPDIAQLMNVSMDVAETEQAFEVKVDLPGIDPEQVDIQIDNNTLTIRGQRAEETEETDEKKQFHRVERYQGSFARSVVLPNAINEDETAAEFRDGVLKIIIPKLDEAKPRKISISR